VRDSLTFSSELPLWELESQWTPKFSENNFKGQNPLDWSVIYIIKKKLERKCLKWARMTHLGDSNTSYGQMKGRESNWQFDSQPLKVRNRLDPLMFRWLATYHWKNLDRGYNFASALTSIVGLHTKLWASKVTGVLILKISKLPLGNPRTIWHLSASLMAKHRIYYKEEGGGFFQVWAVVSLCLPMARSCTKNVITMH
jgi:hypothetical protein